MTLKKNSELIFGLAILALGIFYLILTSLLPRKAMVDATFIPYFIAAFIIILGVLQILAGMKLSKEFKEKDYVAENIDYLTVLKTVALIVIYIAFLETVGFLICSVIFLILEFIVLTPANEKKNYILYIAIAIIASASIYFAFRYGLDLMLPKGFLTI